MMKVMIESMNNRRRGLTEVCGTRRNGETEQNVPPCPPRVSGLRHRDQNIIVSACQSHKDPGPVITAQI